MQKIADYFRAAIPVVAIDAPSVDEIAVLTDIVTEFKGNEKFTAPVLAWSLSRGFVHLDIDRDGYLQKSPVTDFTGSRDPWPGDALTYIENRNTPDDSKEVYILHDIHPYLWADPARVDLSLVRRFKDLCLELKGSARRIVLLGQGIVVSDEFAGLVYSHAVNLPVDRSIHSALLQCIEDLQGVGNIEISPDLDVVSLVRAARGLTLEELGDAIRYGAIVAGGAINNSLAGTIAEFKIAKLTRLGVEFSPAPDVPVGGLNALVEWVRKRSKLFNASLAENSPLPRPRGLVLVGVPGTGKSLVAKTIGSLWGVPILKLDIGALMNSLVGESEKNLRAMLKTAEAVAPCVLFIDEIEKALAGASSFNDSGVSARIFGTLLGWMQDKTSPVFVVATSNDITALPPELTRKGRFDEIFFVDLPDEGGRREILTYHLNRYGVNLPDTALNALVNVTGDYSGAEIAGCIDDAAIAAFDEARFPNITHADIERAVHECVPLARRESARITTLRERAGSIARPASVREAPSTATGRGRQIRIAD